jgi:hypothetical protein
MGAGVKSGTPAGGKGVAQPSRPTLAQPGQVSTLQPGSQIFGGTVTPNTIGPNGLPVGGTMPAGYTSPIPAQGGKFPSNPQQPTTSNIPGYAHPSIGPRSAGPGAPIPSYIAEKYAEMERMGAGQPQHLGQVPAQGGKAPITLPPGVEGFPAPQVQQPAPVMPRPVMPRPTMTRPSSIGAGLAGLRGRR